MTDLYDLRKRAAGIINSGWNYSWHWGKHPEERHWTMEAKHDCIERIYKVEEELRQLKNMRKELEEVALLHIPETD
jgi:hypothetical protein